MSGSKSEAYRLRRGAAMPHGFGLVEPSPAAFWAPEHYVSDFHFVAADSCADLVVRIRQGQVVGAVSLGGHCDYSSASPADLGAALLDFGIAHVKWSATARRALLREAKKQGFLLGRKLVADMRWLCAFRRGAVRAEERRQAAAVYSRPPDLVIDEQEWLARAAAQASRNLALRLRVLRGEK